VTRSGSGSVVLQSAWGCSPGNNRFPRRAIAEGHVVKVAGTEDRASVERSASRQAPHPRPVLSPRLKANVRSHGRTS